MPRRARERRESRMQTGLSIVMSTTSRLGTAALATISATVKKLSMPQKVSSLLDKLASYLKLVAWTLRVAQKQTRSNTRRWRR